MKISYEIVRSASSLTVAKITDKQYYRLINDVVIVKENQELADMVVEFFLELAKVNSYEIDCREG